MNSFQGLCPNPIERKLLTHSHASNTKIKEEHQTQKRERHEKAVKNFMFLFFSVVRS